MTGHQLLALNGMATLPPLATQARKITGYGLARKYGAKVVVVSDATDAQYLARKGLVVLPRSVAVGTDAHALATAAHETAHFLQPSWMHWLRIIAPLRWWHECDAWDKAMTILSIECR